MLSTALQSECQQNETAEITLITNENSYQALYVHAKRIHKRSHHQKTMPPESQTSSCCDPSRQTALLRSFSVHPTKYSHRCNMIGRPPQLVAHPLPGFSLGTKCPALHRRTNHPQGLAVQLGRIDLSGPNSYHLREPALFKSFTLLPTQRLVSRCLFDGQPVLSRRLA